MAESQEEPQVPMVEGTRREFTQKIIIIGLIIVIVFLFAQTIGPRTLTAVLSIVLSIIALYALYKFLWISKEGYNVLDIVNRMGIQLYNEGYGTYDTSVENTQTDQHGGDLFVRFRSEGLTVKWSLGLDRIIGYDQRTLDVIREWYIKTKYMDIEQKRLMEEKWQRHQMPFSPPVVRLTPTEEPRRG